jgi:hypothetical protein
MTTGSLNAVPTKSAERGIPVIDVSKAALRLGRKMNVRALRHLATPAPWYRQFAHRQAA